MKASEIIKLDKDSNEVSHLVRRFYFRFNDSKEEEVLKRQIEKVFDRIKDKYPDTNSSLKASIGYNNTDFVDGKKTLKIEIIYLKVDH